jgi:CubicO group peptidase (beta-lactamase class C family)
MADLPVLLSEAAVPAMTGAVIREGRLDRLICGGIRSVQKHTYVDEDTVFEAASLSKPVFAYMVLQLVDRGQLSVDAPLDHYLPNYIPIDKWVSAITARQVLSHSCGLPNWRNMNLPLKVYFEPGSRFSYSGEGFLYLQKAVEAITGEKMHVLVERLVCEPLGMSRSSFIWNQRFDNNRAYGHDAFGRSALSYKPGEANAAWSLQTTAADYSRFLLAVLDGSRLKPETAELWLQPQVKVKHTGIQCLGPTDGDVETGVAWGLGWGLEPGKGTFFHWGDNGSFTAFVLGSMQHRAGLVVFTNGASGLSIIPELVADIMPSDRPSFIWLDYVRHDAPVRQLLRAACASGLKAVWRNFEGFELSSDDLRWVAQGLLAAGREDDSRWLRECRGTLVGDLTGGQLPRRGDPWPEG